MRVCSLGIRGPESRLLEKGFPIFVAPGRRLGATEAVDACEIGSTPPIFEGPRSRFDE